jgi:replicative DNA helicase
MDATGNPDTEQYLILAQELMRRIYADDSSEAIHMWLQSQLAKMGTLGSETAALLWADSFAYYDALLEKRVERANLPMDERKELRWAWNTWNRMIDPLEPGLLCVIAAGDGVGKTIYAETQAEHWAKSGLKVDFIHFELNRAIMLDRRAARHTGISRRELKSGPFTPTIHREWHEARNRLSGWDGTITYWHAPGWSMEKVTRNLEQKVANGETDVVVIDYLEKAQPSDRQKQLFGANNWQREADDVEIIKTFAERMETPALLLAQMNKTGKTSSLHSLDRTAIRGAGEKTEKANIVVLLSREKTEDGYSPVVDVRLDKNTLGPTGNFQQYLDGAHFQVRDIAS